MLIIYVALSAEELKSEIMNAYFYFGILSGLCDQIRSLKIDGCIFLKSIDCCVVS